MAHVLLVRTVLRRQPLVINRIIQSRFRSIDFKERSQAQSSPNQQSTSGPQAPSDKPLRPNGSASSPSGPHLKNEASVSPTLDESSGSLPQTSPPPPSKTALTLDFAPGSVAEFPGARTGAKSAKGSLSTIERRRRFMSRVVLGILTLGMGFGVVHLGRPWQPDELNKLSKEQETAGRWARTSHRFLKIAGIFSEPQWEQLLPPQATKMEQRPYTLLLSIDDLLVTSTWDRQHGWRTAKRPGVDYFLAYLQQWYEIVIFTSQPFYTADPIIEKLDPLHAYITYRLFRESTHYHDGKVVKDLSFLNRDLSRVVAVDTNSDSYALHRENAIVLPKWNGDPNDKGLIAIIPLLEAIGIYNPPDVRPIVRTYIDQDVALEYNKSEAEAKRKHIEEWEREGGRRKTAPSFLGGLLGTSGSNVGDKPPLTYLERRRLEAQRNYRLDQEYLKKNEDTIKKWLQDQQDANLQALGPSSLLGALSSWSKPPPERMPATPAESSTTDGAEENGAEKNGAEKNGAEKNT